jgi:hypothetical protein
MVLVEVTIFMVCLELGGLSGWPHWPLLTLLLSDHGVWDSPALSHVTWDEAAVFNLGQLAVRGDGWGMSVG